jgi:uncharacterized protein YidB (DUF937 family)
MGILDSLTKNPELLANIGEFASANPDIAKAAMSLFSASDTSVGDSGGLGGILGALQSGGLGDVVSSWVGGGDNKAVAPQQLESALGSDTLAQFAQKAGVSGSEASTVLAGMLPSLVDQLTPDGNLPDSGGLDSMIGGLLGALKT